MPKRFKEMFYVNLIFSDNSEGKVHVRWQGVISGEFLITVSNQVNQTHTCCIELQNCSHYATDLNHDHYQT